MPKGYTTLVLGAGSSLGFGYPTGEKLREWLTSMGSQSVMQRLPMSAEAILRFSKAFLDSQQSSIDAFLARRSEYVEVGKLAIAAVLSERQERVRLLNPLQDPWQRLLLKKITEVEWDLLSFSRLAIITFNYDVSLEEFLLIALSETYGKSREEVAAKLRELEIIHVYGALGDPLDLTSGYRYKSGRSENDLMKMAQGLRIIPEGRDNDPQVLRARRKLLQAEAIAFLGFSFDSLNMVRLDSLNTCRSTTGEGSERVKRKIVGTCYGMTEAELRAALLAMNVAPTETYHGAGTARGALLKAFYPMDCTSMLRETLILSRLNDVAPD